MHFRMEVHLFFITQVVIIKAQATFYTEQEYQSLPYRHPS